jgi:anti-sigma factor RsiW
MKLEQQLKLQSFLDGELSDRETREILAWTQRDSDAAALLAELKNTRQAVTQSKSHLSVPEPREFYWSKIQREIQRREPVATPLQRPSLFVTLRRLLVPAGAVAALAIMGMLGHLHFNPAAKTVVAEVPEIETTLADADAVTYRDEQENTTLVWLSYPADGKSAPAKPAHS